MAGIDHLDFEFTTFGEKAADLLIRPVRPFLPVLQATAGKPVGEFTMPELLAWLAVAVYAGMAAATAAELIAAVAGFVLRGPARR